MDHIIITLTPLIIGWLLDLAFGDPAWLPHPVVGYGRAISACEHRLNHGRGRMAKGAVTAIGLILIVYAVAAVVMNLLSRWEIVWVIAGTVGVFYCLAGTTLVSEVRMVFEATDRSLEAGRRQVARIVGRDTGLLSANEIRTAALETLAENLSDGVVAPLFWYALLGLPGMLAYKMVNTLDSMTGYRNAKFKDFGCFAARIDDVANYIPARLTALLLLIAAGKPRLIPTVWRNGRNHASPNSGYPEAALAAVLDCRFGGTHNYFGEAVYKPYIGENQRELTTADMKRSIRLSRRAEVMAVGLTALVALIL